MQITQNVGDEITTADVRIVAHDLSMRRPPMTQHHDAFRTAGLAALGELARRGRLPVR
jgi:hypothetical protein